MNGRSYLLWEVLRLDHSRLGWLSKTPNTWQEDADYMTLFDFVNNMTCVNDPSERVVQLAEKRVKTVRSEERFQETLLTVQELNLLSAGLKRDRFNNNDLQKLMEVA